MKTGPAAAVATALVCGAFVTSCGEDAGGRVEESNGRFVLIAPFDSSNVAGVGLGGRVEMVGDCLGIDDQVVLWPEGTDIVLASPLTMDVPRLGRVQVGDRVDGGGQMADAPEGLSVPAGCASETLTHFFVA